jgi:hypothetical protein
VVYTFAVRSTSVLYLDLLKLKHTVAYSQISTAMENPRLQAALADPSIDADVPFRASSSHRHHTWVCRCTLFADSMMHIY